VWHERGALAENATRGKGPPPARPRENTSRLSRPYRQGMPVPALSAALHTITPGCYGVHMTAPQVESAYKGTYVSCSDCCPAMNWTQRSPPCLDMDPSIQYEYSQQQLQSRGAHSMQQTTDINADFSGEVGCFPCWCVSHVFTSTSNPQLVLQREGWGVLNAGSTPLQRRSTSRSQPSNSEPCAEETPQVSWLTR
jgi:DNA-binding transcriptional regulator YdaS (Cro superfamily)